MPEILPAKGDPNTSFKKFSQSLLGTFRPDAELLFHNPHNFAFQLNAGEEDVVLQTLRDRRPGHATPADGRYPNT